MLSKNCLRMQGYPLYWLLLLLLVLPLSSITAASDRLEQPAQIAIHPERSLLLDITRVGSRLVAVGEQGTIIWSDDQGEQWQQADVPVSVLLTAVAFADSNNGWAVGHDGAILRSSDRGETWQRVADGNVVNQWQVARYEHLNAAGTDPRTPEVSADDFAVMLDDALFAQEEGATYPLLDVFFSDAQHGFILGAYGLLLRTSDGGDSWQVDSHVVPNIDRFHLNSMAQVAGRLFIAGEAGVLFRSLDQGQHWEALASPYEGSFFKLQAYEQADLERVYAMGLRGHLFYSDDFGEQWQQVLLETTASLTAATVADTTLLFAGSGGFVATGDAPDALASQRLSSRASISQAAAAESFWVLVGETGVVRLMQGDDSHGAE